MKKLFVLPLVIVPFIALMLLFSTKALAATDQTPVRDSHSGILFYGHTYEGLGTSLEVEYQTDYAGSSSVYAYSIDWPVSITVEFPSSLNYSFSGSFLIPVAHAIIPDPYSNLGSDYIITEHFDDVFTVEPFSSVAGYSYSVVSFLGGYYVNLIFDNFDPSSFFDGQLYRFISISGSIHGGVVIGSASTIRPENVYFQDSFTVAGSILSSNLVPSVSFQTVIQNAINGSSDIDSIIALLNSLYFLQSGDSSTLATLGLNVSSIQSSIVSLGSIVASSIDSSTDIDVALSFLSSIDSDLYTYILPQVSHIDTLLAGLVSSYQTNSVALQSSVNDLISYMSSIDSSLGEVQVGSSPYTVLRALYLLISRIGSNSGTNTGVNVIGNLNRLLTSADNIYSKLDTTHRLLTYIYAGLTGMTSYTDIQSTSHDFWVGIIQDALSDFDFNINQDIQEGDTVINNNITQNDLRKIYNEHKIIQDFQIDISLDFADYMEQLDFNSVSFNSAPVSIQQATTTGLSLIERVYNKLGDYTFLITITLFIGLVSALLGPINRFISKKVS